MEVDDSVTKSEGMEVSAPTENKPVETVEAHYKTKLKDFSLMSVTLFPTIPEEDLDKAFGKSKTKAAHNQATPSEDDFEVVPMSMEEDNNTNESKPECKSPFVTAAISLSQKTVTENLAPTFSTSDDARLDFFFGVMEQTSQSGTLLLLQNSWTTNPLDSLKLLANLRDIRSGKGIRPQYQQCLYWMYQNHPETLYKNLSELLKFGYWKDVLHLLVIIIFDGYMHPYFEQDANPKKKSKKAKNGKHPNIIRRQMLRKLVPRKSKGQKPLKIEKDSDEIKAKKAQVDAAVAPIKQTRIAADAEKRIYNQKILDYYSINKTVSSLSKNEMSALRLKFARDKFAKDLKYRAFHMKVAEVFADQLIQDIAELNKEKVKGVSKKDISLAGKWAPSLEAHFDKYLLIGTTIALEIAKKTGKSSDLLLKSPTVATYLARKIYNKDYCVPLRRYQDIPEHYMSTNKWDKLNYSRVPAKCMTKNKEHFMKHDKERFSEYLSRPDSKVTGTTLKPVELISQAMSLSHDSEKEKRIILEKQWDSLAESIKKNGGGMLKNAVSICDVSGSMSGTPMQAAIGLTLLTMRMSEEPWNSMCITFSAIPQIFNLDPNLGIVDKIQALKGMDWEMNTDLHKVFQLILSLGKDNNLKEEDMPKLLFIFTDMEFDEACTGSNLTNFEAAKLLFESNGYKMPSVVFWNLRDTQHSFGGKLTATSTPVQKNELGVILLSGFAGQTLSHIMTQEDFSKCSPLQFMLDVLNKEIYSKLAIYD